MKETMKNAITVMLSVGIAFAVLAPAWAGAESAGAESMTGRMGSMSAEKQQQFRTMPDTATFDVGGRRMTKREMTAAMAQVGARRQNGGPGDFAAVQARFERERLAKLGTENNQVMLKLNTLGQNAARYAAIQQEAFQLNNQSRGASPRETQRLAERAQELLDELKQLGYE